jgi:hypothetical protein
MNKLVWHSEYAQLLKQYPDLTELVWKQIQKDFAMEVLPLPEKEVTTLDEAYAVIYPEVKHFIEFQFASLMRLLYRIDISETTVRKQMDVMPYDTAQAICTLILQREIQKVILRKQYSS